MAYPYSSRMASDDRQRMEPYAARTLFRLYDRVADADTPDSGVCEEYWRFQRKFHKFMRQHKDNENLQHFVRKLATGSSDSDSDSEADGAAIAYSAGDSDSEAHSGSSFSSLEFWYKPMEPRWKDEAFLTNIPDVFTIDLDHTIDADSLELQEALCKCHNCQDWFIETRKTYSQARYCVRTVQDAADFDYYGLDDSDAEIDAHKLHALTQASSGNMIICVNHQQNQEAPFDPYNEVKILFPHDDKIGMLQEEYSSTFTLRSLSPDDLSAEDFQSRIGGIIGKIDSHANWDRARGYLAQCQEEHAECRRHDAASHAASFRPTRLIDVCCDTDSRLKLIEKTSVSVGRSTPVPYVALSYCWGPPSGQRYCTTQDNITTRCGDDGFDMNEQPLSIQQAVRVARELGFRFVWIDSLCIIQDNDADKENEIMQMGDVYQHAVLLIAASRSRCVQDGFLEDIDLREVEREELICVIPFRYRLRGRQGFVLLESWKFEGIIPHIQLRRSEPIHLRGWTFQEHTVSKRIIAFGFSGMRWQCLTQERLGSWNHSVHADSSEKLAHRPPGEKYIYADLTQARMATKQDWDSKREILCSRSFSHPADRLPGIAAVAKAWGHAFQGPSGGGEAEPDPFSYLPDEVARQLASALSSISYPDDEEKDPDERLSDLNEVVRLVAQAAYINGESAATKYTTTHSRFQMSNRAGLDRSALADIQVDEQCALSLKELARLFREKGIGYPDGHWRPAHRLHLRVSSTVEHGTNPDQHSDAYIAGHWLSHLPRDLIWSGRNLWRDRPWPFPSWSWARGQISHHNNSRFWADREMSFESYDQSYAREDTAGILAWELTLANPRSPLGDVLAARLLLAANLVPFEISGYGKNNPARPIALPASAFGPEGRIEYSIDKYYQSEELPGVKPDGDALATEHFFLEIFVDALINWTSIGLVVRRCVDTRSDDTLEVIRIGTYQYRLGPTQYGKDEDESEDVDPDWINPFDICGEQHVWLV